MPEPTTYLDTITVIKPMTVVFIISCSLYTALLILLCVHAHMTQTHNNI